MPRADETGDLVESPERIERRAARGTSRDRGGRLFRPLEGDRGQERAPEGVVGELRPEGAALLFGAPFEGARPGRISREPREPRLDSRRERLEVPDVAGEDRFLAAAERLAR